MCLMFFVTFNFKSYRKLTGRRPPPPYRSFVMPVAVHLVQGSALFTVCFSLVFAERSAPLGLNRLCLRLSFVSVKGAVGVLK